MRQGAKIHMHGDLEGFRKKHLTVPQPEPCGSRPFPHSVSDLPHSNTPRRPRQP